MAPLPIAAAFGLEPTLTRRFETEERRALRAARRLVVTGPGARPLLARYGIPADHVSTIEPGTDAAPLAQGSRGNALQLLCVATIHPGKGHDLLLAALEPLLDADWELTCAGSLTRDSGFVEALRAEAEPAPPAMGAVSSREQAVPVAPRALVSDKASGRTTVVEVNARDRPGLLARLAHVIHSAGHQLHSAHIATYGQRAVDVFYLTRSDGKKLSEAEGEQLRGQLLAIAAGE